MGKTYTPNLNLALQQDKSDQLDWDAVTENWQKIDAAFGSFTPSVNSGNAVLLSNGIISDTIGIAEQEG